LLTGGRPDGCKSSCGAKVKSHSPDQIEKKNRRRSERRPTHPRVGLPRQGQTTMPSRRAHKGRGATFASASVSRRGVRGPIGVRGATVRAAPCCSRAR
jgi:hypothetical protein